MTVFCFSQNIYPKKLLIEGDTIVAILPMQLRGINQLLVERKIYIEANEEIQVRMTALIEDIKKANKLNEDKTKLINLQAEQIETYKKLTFNADKNIEAMKSEISNQKRKKFRSTVMTVGITAVTTTAAVLLLK